MGPPGLQRSEAWPGGCAPCPAALALERAWSAWRSPLPFPLFGGLPAWWPRWHLQEAQGWSPELGHLCQETLLGATRTAGWISTLCVGSSFSRLLFWHMAPLGCFSAQLYLYWGLEGKAVVSTLFQPSPASGAPILALTPASRVAPPWALCKAGGEDAGSSPCRLSWGPEPPLSRLRGTRTRGLLGFTPGSATCHLCGLGQVP